MAVGGSKSYGGYFYAGSGTSNIGVYAVDGSYGGGSVHGPGTPNSANCAAFLDGDVYITATYSASDDRLKSDIHEFDGALDKLKKLNTKTYVFNSAKYKNSMNLPEESQIGIMASNLQSVFPNLVKEKIAPGHIDPHTQAKLGDDTKFLAVNYTGLIPVLVQAVKELDSQNSELKAQNARLQDQISDLCNGGCATLKVNDIGGDQSSNVLRQNIPNPFSQKTSIGYVINNGTKGYIIISGLDGKIIKHIDISGKGAGSIEIGANEMASGTYTYSLFVDDNVVDTKIMVIYSQN